MTRSTHLTQISPVYCGRVCVRVCVCVSVHIYHKCRFVYPSPLSWYRTSPNQDGFNPISSEVFINWMFSRVCKSLISSPLYSPVPRTVPGTWQKLKMYLLAECWLHFVLMTPPFYAQGRWGPETSTVCPGGCGFPPAPVDFLLRKSPLVWPALGGPK